MIERAYVFLFLWTVFIISLLFFTDRDMMRERRRPGTGGSDYFTARCTRLLYVIHALFLVQAVVYQRVVSEISQITGFLTLLMGMLLIFFSMKVNLFFSSVIRIQEERSHRVVSHGPYRWVRHPGYLGMTLLILGGGILFESWAGLSILSLWLPVIFRRLSLEENALLKAFPEYASYSKKVRWKLLPGLF